MPRPFRQVDVFASDPFTGNPVAVVLDAEGLDTAAMQSFARWTNLSETTFLLPPEVPGADYRVRIFTPAAELPFAGHPTLGSAWAWLEATGSDAAELVQECEVGLVPLRRTGEGVAFAAPPLLRSGEVDEADLETAVRPLCMPASAVEAAAWVDNGPGWLALRLADAGDVLALDPDFGRVTIPTGVIGPYPDEGPFDFEVRAFVPALGVPEDPVTGSLNAGIARWFFESGQVAGGYVVRQGTVVGAAGTVQVDRDADGTIWVGGRCTTRIEGAVAI